MKKNKLILLLGLLLMVLAPMMPVSAQEDIFTYAIDGDPMSLNPVTVSDRWGLTTVNMIYSPLIRVEGDGSQKYELAKDLEVSEDGKTITVSLRDDVKWSDGQAFTAEDVVFTYEKKADKANGNADSLWIGDQAIEVEAKDDHTVVFHLPEANAAAVNNIATETYIMPKHVFEQEADFSVNKLKAAPVGTGPYQLKEYRRGEYLSFEANESYYGGPANIKNIVFRIISNADTKKVALQKGEVDAAIIMPKEIADFDEDQIASYPYSENRVGYIGVNANTVKDQKLRQAIFFALNRDELNQAIYLDSKYYNNVYSFLPPHNPYYTDEVEQYQQDLEKAKSLLNESDAGQVNLTLGYTADDPNQTIQATLIQQYLQQAGIPVELKGVDGASLYSTLAKDDQTDYDLFIGGYIMGTDPDFYAALYKSDGSYNTFNLANEKVDQLFEQGAKELDDNKRQEIYHQLQKEVADSAVIFPMVDNQRIFAVNKRIGNVEAAKFVPIYTMEDMSKLTFN